MKELVVYKITKTNDYKNSMKEDELLRQSSNRTNDIIGLECVHRYRVFDHEKEKLIPEDLWYLTQPLFVDNKGDVAFLHIDERIFQINGINHWDDFEHRVIDKAFDMKCSDIYKFGAGSLVIKHKEDILLIKFNEKKITSSKLIKHKAVDIEDQCDLDNIVISKNPRYLIMMYDLGGAMTIIVWDTEKNIEHTNFLGRKEDDFLDYITGKNSILGFLCFQNYIVDLDLGVPIPFMKKKFSTDDRLWGQGMRINCNEDVMLSNGTMITPL